MCVFDEIHRGKRKRLTGLRNLITLHLSFRANNYRMFNWVNLTQSQALFAFTHLTYRDNAMPHREILKGKRILAVDDEPDVLELMREQLADCELTTAGNFEAASELIRLNRYDLVILDIMGVDGFTLLDECRIRKLPAAILTAHAISVDSINRSIKLGAVSFLPKEELERLPELIAEILSDLAEGKTHWQRLFERLGPFFKERLGLTWEDLEQRPLPPYRY